MDLHAVPGRRRSAALLAVALCAVLPAPAALAQAFHVVPEADRTMSEAEWQAMKARAVPDVRLVDPAARRPRAAPVFSTSPPELVPGNPGTAPNLAERGGFDLPAGGEGIEPENYGKDHLGTIYHFNDYLQVPRPVRYYPWRAVGRIFTITASGKTGVCTGALIARSIIVTAGHCVHQGGNRDAGWNRSTVFVPAADGALEPYGRCNGNYLITTDQWFDDGEFQVGHDVGLIGCGKRVGTSREIGWATGWFGHCASGCLLPNWFFTQIGYPENYYDGDYMTVSQHLAIGTVWPDFLYGTGMRDGSSGGPHVSNIGSLSDSSSDLGQWNGRNYIFAVTSWQWNDHQWKTQGASSLSGPEDSNDWKEMFNWVCDMVQGAHGRRSCTPFP
ncbi:MAG: trypsin-like serine protease [Rhodobacteraceae bacterium]|nr:trypsin-like serine protease [Paracoccaceae bacterium]